MQPAFSTLQVVAGDSSACSSGLTCRTRIQSLKRKRSGLLWTTLRCGQAFGQIMFTSTAHTLPPQSAYTCKQPVFLFKILLSP